MTELTERLNFHAIVGPNGRCLCGVEADGSVVTCGALLDEYLALLLASASALSPDPSALREAANPPENYVDKTKRGLYRKFKVTRTDGTSARGGKHDGCNYFVLDVTHDKHADAALRAYADSCEAEYPLLAADLRDLSSQPAAALASPREPQEGQP